MGLLGARQADADYIHPSGECQGLTERLLVLLDQLSIRGKQVHDANIVATMQVNQIVRLLTRNVADFARSPT